MSKWDSHIGFTGTQRGMTELQKIYFVELLKAHQPFTFHHGDCIGADDDAGNLCLNLACTVVIHPPIYTSKRAFNKNFINIRDPKPYLDRNHDIIDESDFLVATPGEKEEQLRSGTWTTIRYARKKGKRIYIIYPDGTIDYE